MRKFLCSIFMPLLAVICLCGCGAEINVKNIKNNYNELTTNYIYESENAFFNDTDKPNTIAIYYPNNLKEIIYSENEQQNDFQKRCRAIYYQQQILTNIFDGYEKYSDDFYLVAESKKIDN